MMERVHVGKGARLQREECEARPPRLAGGGGRAEERQETIEHRLGKQLNRGSGLGLGLGLIRTLVVHGCWCE